MTDKHVRNDIEVAARIWSGMAPGEGDHLYSQWLDARRTYRRQRMLKGVFSVVGLLIWVALLLVVLAPFFF